MTILATKRTGKRQRKAIVPLFANSTEMEWPTETLLTVQQVTDTGEVIKDMRMMIISVGSPTVVRKVQGGDTHDDDGGRW